MKDSNNTLLLVFAMALFTIVICVWQDVCTKKINENINATKWLLTEQDTNNNLIMNKCPSCFSGAALSHAQNDLENLSWIVRCGIDSDTCMQILDRWYPNINEAIDAWNLKTKK